MKISSPDFINNQNLPVKYTCDGDGIGPALNFSEVPTAAKSLALIVDDPDAPSGTFVHWVVWSIPVGVSSLTAGKLPAGTMVGKNTLGKNSFVPPCPPSGTHRYFFKLYALDLVLNLADTATKDHLLNIMTGHILDQAELVGFYKR